jgi:hypothetical protein
MLRRRRRRTLGTSIKNRKLRRLEGAGGNKRRERNCPRSLLGQMHGLL